MFIKIFVFIIAIFFCGIGIAVTTQADLGTTPISSLPYVLTFITHLSFGITTFIINILFIIAEVFIMKREFKKKDYLQIFVTVLLGICIDFGMYLSEPFKTTNYFGQILMLVIGTAILAFGVTLEVMADIMYVPGEGIVKAISYKISKDFGKIKIEFDITQCIISIILSLIFLHSIQGLREGTVIAAFLTGLFVSLYYRLLTKITMSYGHR